MPQAETIAPPRPQKLTVQVEHTAEGLLLYRRNVQKAAGAFMLLWLTGWTVGCVFLAGMVLHDPQPFLLLFAVPFWASWVLVFFMLLKSFFQRDRLVISKEGVRFDRQVLVPLHERFVPLHEVQRFDVFSEIVDSESGQLHWGLEMENAGTPLRFFPGLEVEERLWLQHTLNDMLTRLKGIGSESAPLPVDAPSRDELAHNGNTANLTVSTKPVRPPADCRWQRLDGYQQIAFMQRGRFVWQSIFGLLFINVFWNGVVGVFVMVLFGGGPGGFGGPQNAAPEGIAWWGLFLFLIPFEVLGFLMFGGLLLALIDPFRRTTWTIEERAISYRQKWFGQGRHKTYEIDRLQRLELQSRDDASNGKFSVTQMAPSSTPHNDTPFVLMFIDTENRVACEIAQLTEGEARWMADVVLRERPSWFR